MEQYINKSALVAEIDKRKNLCEKIVLDLRTKENKDYYQGKAVAYSEMVELINPLEMKEVDLEEEICDWIGDEESCKDGKWTWYECNKMIRRFFKLGMSVSNNIWHDARKEIPTKFGATILVACRNKNMEDGIWLYDLIQCLEGEYKPRENWEDPLKWAYIDDLAQKGE